MCVEFYRLVPGTFVRLTPQSAEFQRAVEADGLNLEELLQSTLMRHTALSEGDWVTVDMPGGACQRLQVRCAPVCAAVPRPRSAPAFTAAARRCR